ncbi:hypothetical protein PFICI_09445 [Pestalotiopsis fici W106-1]|uniref:Ribonucleases P/MRP subunit Pop8-like domain-containing protein n=1 Tax=Pestalotiopsis fici (strain W106-1 / CGMCC3.15140) TaxID=1229662 RepID=W3X2G8_PESFW|nr:uncharacterized protein PFICI_09445 [Pestalotiopsis fici W106-1]ETS79592.1 hypothetical protein PFICI_09445 [Pestalotiopsis fici W106-1]
MAEPGNTTITSISSTAATSKSHKAQELATCTIRAPPFSYAHLEAMRKNSLEALELDAIQVRSYCSAALKQFLGVSGQAISIDILKVEGPSCWLRIPRDDLSAFAAAITAWQGTYEGGTHSTLRVRGCSDWLGSLVGSEGAEQLWRG